MGISGATRVACIVKGAMHLDEEVEIVAQKDLVVSRGHAVEQLEELLLLLGRRWKHVLRLNVIGLFRQAERADRGVRTRVSE